MDGRVWLASACVGICVYLLLWVASGAPGCGAEWGDDELGRVGPAQVDLDRCLAACDGMGAVVVDDAAGWRCLCDPLGGE